MKHHCIHSLLLALMLLSGTLLFISVPAFAEESHGNSSASSNEKGAAPKAKKKSTPPKDIPPIDNQLGEKNNTDKSSSKSKSSKKSSSSSSKSANSKSSKSTKSKSSSSKHKSSKSSHSKSNQDDEIYISNTSSHFSQAEINRYKEMPYETWESPTGKSELGLPIAENMAQPYPYSNLLRQYDGNKCRHRGHDIGYVGEKNNGMGSVINSAANAVITLIGRTGEDIGEFGKLDKRSGYAVRTKKSFPRQILAPGYGIVYPFSTNYGRWRSGMVIVTKVLDGPLKDYTIRYMHMGAIRPDLKVGDTVKAGEHIALMGGTAVLDSWPHLHLDAESPTGKRIDLGPYIGIPESGSHCRGKSAKSSSKSSKSKKSSGSKSSKHSGSSKSSKISTSQTTKPKHRPRSSYTQKAVTEPAQTRTLER
ncbi:MAG: M23 family metallopeptidase [Proteobacteria bacterium]|nr:M23 family metallopeptidase [Pseudomonadota bacterium]